ncbi:hypothetical protein TRFO_37422 [Tritrichomonas foetus]|uniref:Uncharacterized protein n=1 Tax=Tritrichomonas foetus TaxID=1144522 RepID=A0A1J4JDP9_9EUKA|nr:hypothetical protein TRFO_37422 [Tritrichomonas foetus]|eukprot:OHS96415.1 hypothetical protein TRFO_37422 [Tritrichomonas foetus]
MIESISLSNDCNSIAFSINHGFVVYSTDPLVRKFSKEFALYHISKIATDGDGTFVAFVGISEDNEENPTIFVWNNFYAECHCKLEMDEKVLNIKLLGQLLLIIFEKRSCIYDLQRKMMRIESPTGANPSGAADIVLLDSSLARISEDDDDDDGNIGIDENIPLVAICANEVGKINIYKMTENPVKINIYAAKHQVNLIRFSPDGYLVATASAKGTLIRVFDTKTGAALSTFRRGTLSPASILDCCFSPAKSELIAISSNGTIHLFKADVRNASQNDFPRSCAKLSIEKVSFVAAAFKAPDSLTVLTSSGSLLSVKVSNDKLELAENSSVLEH